VKFIVRRFILLACAGALALAACSSNTMPRMNQAPSESAQSVLDASSYVRVMAESASVNSIGGFTLTSTTFKNNAIVPPNMIGIAPPQCHGTDLSPALFWSHPPAGTKSFALVLFDETANFGHWGIYNMRSIANRLPQGVKPGNLAPYWLQVVDDAGVQGYFGPCPPPGIVHHYVFTIYALDKMLTLQNNPPLPPPNIESLLYAMIGHVIGRASITGLLQKT
jgi:Raf kinase inhibitor-like YbhB/YbcL family protein